MDAHYHAAGQAAAPSPFAYGKLWPIIRRHTMSTPRLPALAAALGVSYLLLAAPASAQVERSRSADELEQEANSKVDSAKGSAKSRSDTIRPAVAKQKTASGPLMPAGRKPPKPVLTTQESDAELLAAWSKWREAIAKPDSKAAEAAQAELLRLKEDLAISDLETFSTGFIRAAEAKTKANDEMGAVALATTAADLSPHLPYARLALAHAQLDAQPLAVGLWGGEMKAAIGQLLSDPRFVRPVLADVGAALLFALVATAAAVAVVLFARRVRYFLHDFHHLFPRAASRWQSGFLAFLILTLPIGLHLGIVPTLLVMLLSVSLYLSAVERWVAAVLLVLVSVIPLLAGLLADGTGFAGTLAEDVYRLERGGLEANSAAERTRKRLQDGRADFPEMFALGRYELRRGQLDSAVEHFKLAAQKRTNDARLLVNLGNALMAKGDAEGAMEVYKNATEADPNLAAAHYNLSKLYARRAALLPDEAVVLEMDKAHAALQTAQQLDESLVLRGDPPEDRLLANRLLVSPGLSLAEINALAAASDVGAKVRAQVSSALLGAVEPPIAWVYPAVGAALLMAFGAAASMLKSSRVCEKCGRPVCQRCDPEIGVASTLCGQCVNVFSRKGVVPARLKLRKQLEVARYQERRGRMAYVFGMLCSGAGHLFAGFPVTGAIYAFLFLFAFFNAFFRQGVMRSPYGMAPGYLRLAPLAVLFVLTYVLSLRSLYKQQSG